MYVPFFCSNPFHQTFLLEEGSKTPKPGPWASSWLNPFPSSQPWFSWDPYRFPRPWQTGWPLISQNHNVPFYHSVISSKLKCLLSSLPLKYILPFLHCRSHVPSLSPDTSTNNDSSFLAPSPAFSLYWSVFATSMLICHSIYLPYGEALAP